MRRVFIRSQCFTSMMSDLPPRKAPASSKPSKQDASPLQILLQMGFPRHRALKALAATGNRSVQLASDWLLTHVNDNFIDTDAPREYILYACPTGPLSAQLHEFWDKSKTIGGWNGAHNSPPHITLVSFFKAPDESSLQLAKAIKHVVESVGDPPTTPMKLEPYISQNFMGLFVSEQHADYLKKIAVHYVKEVSSALGVSMDTYEHLDALGTCFPWCTMAQEKPIRPVCLEPHVRALHITLAYHFDVSAFDPLKALVDELRPLDSGWELRLYSRDPRFNKHQVHKVRQRYTPKESDELELVIGDYVYIDEKEIAGSVDGWVTGTSWLTGVTGCLPAVFTHRTNESDAWTLHRAISLRHSSSNSDAKSESDSNTEDMSTGYPIEEAEKLGLEKAEKLGVEEAERLGLEAEKLGLEKSEESYQEWGRYWQVVQTTKSASILDVTQGTTSNWSEQNGPGTGDAATATESATNDTNKTGDTSGRRWLFAMRHGERVDLTYGVWVPHCFDKQGNYTRRDLNMPITLADRSGGQIAYERDSPLTRVGNLQAYLVGEGMRLAGVSVAHVYSSCALRCVETAHSFLAGLQASPAVKIRVEPGLFEYKGWHLPRGMAPFMTPQELNQAGYNVDLEYKPYVEIDLVTPETLEECYKRGETVMHTATRDTQEEGGNIIFVGHAATLDIMVTAMRRFDAAPREYPPYQISEYLLRVPYCALSAMKTAPCELVKPPCPPSINSSSGRFDWKILLDIGL